ncbi:GldG family protein [Clostridium sp. SYSU_GA19001]|uniref:GldG family protein n=1 Tax=Clostridium caldaquaticum TaxID=2940653 RepID=UPI00207710A4|nr:GldG family protein [Clostridium caldaquaticum]MCM8711473.1 GldG family protein [Clostridium caldaquaticum]
MKKLDIKNSFKTKKFKYGSYSTAVTALVLAILLVVNFVAGKINIKKDLTKEKIYSLSEESYKILKDLKNDTKIIAFFEAGSENKNFTIILDKYKAASDKITVEYKDPIKNPQITQKYSKSGQTVGVNSIVVESGNKFKVIDYYDFFNVSYDQYGQQKVDSFAAEQQLTNAIVYVNSDKEQILYTLAGHEEKGLGDSITKQLQAENYTIKEINLLQGGTELNKEGTLVVVSPRRDLSKEELEKIKAFLTSGGRAALFMDITKETLPNFGELLSFYGVKLQNALAVEGEVQNVVQQPIDLLPEMQTHDIVNSLKSSKLPVLMPVSQGIDTIELKRSTVKVEPLLSTTKNSWAKVNLNATSIVKEANDIQGPLNIAVAITDEDTTAGRNTKLVVVGGTTFMEDNVNSVTNGANIDFIMNSFNWLQDKKDSVSIRPKSLTTESLMINVLQQLLLSGVVVILIPAVIMIMGITVWLRRRHR